MLHINIQKILINVPNADRSSRNKRAQMLTTFPDGIVSYVSFFPRLLQRRVMW